MEKQGNLHRKEKKRIFHTNFAEELQHVNKVPFWRMHLPTFKRVYIDDRGLRYMVIGTLGILLCNALLLFFTSAVSPLSSYDTIVESKQGYNLAIKAAKDVEDKITQVKEDIEILQKTGALPSTPLLLNTQSIMKQKVNWPRALVGLQNVIKQVISANDVVKQVQLHSLLLKSDDQSFFIDRMKVFGKQSAKSQGSSISLATTLVDTLEQSPFFKNVETDSYTNKATSSTGASLQDLFTPISIKTTIQHAGESSPQDVVSTIEAELQSLSNSSQ